MKGQELLRNSWVTGGFDPAVAFFPRHEFPWVWLTSIVSLCCGVAPKGRAGHNFKVTTGLGPPVAAETRLWLNLRAGWSPEWL